MTILSLKPTERAQLEAIAAKAKRVHEVIRAQALIWLADGVAPTEVGKHVRMSRQGVYLGRGFESDRSTHWRTASGCETRRSARHQHEPGLTAAEENVAQRPSDVWI